MLHIQSGQYRGRKLLTPPKGAQTRPITGQAKKSLFTILAGHLVDASVADLYCGTGTMGLEALSNGARHCCFAERDRVVLDRLRRNIDTLGVTGACAVWPGDILARLAKRLEQLDGPLDVAFVDPPYAHSRGWDWRQLTARLFTPLARHLADDGVVVLRTETQVEVPETLADLVVSRERTYGAMAIRFLTKAEPSQEDDAP